MATALSSIQTEVDAAFLYKVLADAEEDQPLAEIFREMHSIEDGHAQSFLKNNKIGLSQLPPPSFRAKTLKTLGKIFGNDIILGVLMDTEKKLSRNVSLSRKALNSESSISDTAHVEILNNIFRQKEGLAPASITRFEKQHRSVGGNALRAAVLGGNDGLVSNFSLIMGIAGATNGRSEVLLAGIAGLLAGALSMALGEWISVKSSQELYENQIQLERDELENNPEGEEKELALIYQSKGIEREKAKQMARDIMNDKDKAHEVLIREELGINEAELQGSAMEAALASFIFFAIGAIIPVIPFFMFGGFKAVLISTAFAAVGLFLIGSAITLFTGKSIWYSGFRQVIFGILAAAITFGIGRLIGVSVS